MLILSRNLGEGVLIGADVTITVNHIERGRIVLAIDAPPQVNIKRLDEEGEIENRKD